MIAALVFAALSFVSSLLTTVQAILTFLFRRRSRPFAGGLHEQASRPDDSFVSILKPVCGLDDELEENLLSFVSLPGLKYEVIISAETETDPALAVVERVLRAHPTAPFRVIVDCGSQRGVVNRKVERLIAAEAIASGDVIVVSDSNVRVAPDDLRETLRAFGDQSVGCLSNLFVASGARNLGARLEALHLLSFVVPGNVLAAWARVPCLVGKSMAIRRDVLRTIGGFQFFRHTLAEDQAIALAVREAGFRVALSTVVVRNVIIERTIHRAVDRQIRWNKIRYAFSHSLYSAELILNPLPFALLGALYSPTLPAAVFAARILQMMILARATGARLSLRDCAAIPLLDVLMLYAHFVPYFSNRVSWRGYRARVGKNTELLPA